MARLKASRTNMPRTQWATTEQKCGSERKKQHTKLMSNKIIYIAGSGSDGMCANIEYSTHIYFAYSMDSMK